MSNGVPSGKIGFNPVGTVGVVGGLIDFADGRFKNPAGIGLSLCQ